MATTPSMKVTKSFTFEGQAKLWSNRYHFNGGTPADSTHWTTLSDAVVTAEKAIYSGSTSLQIVRVDGYAAGSDVPVFSKTYTTAGTGAFASPIYLPGHMCALLRYSTTARTSKNHPVYLFSYYHGALGQNGGDLDQVNTAQKTAIQAYGNSWVTGFTDGTNTLKRAGPNGATGTAALAENYLSHRDFR